MIGLTSPRAILFTALAVAAAGCAAGSATTRPAAFPNVPPPAWHSLTDSPALRAAVVGRAMSLRGTRYTVGGDRPASGFDCSGLVRYVFLESRVELPRTAEEQFRSGQPIARGSEVAGDLIFFATTGRGPSHVGIVVDRTTFVHAPGSGGVVRAERFDTPYWRTRLQGIRRVRDQGAVADGAAGR